MSVNAKRNRGVSCWGRWVIKIQQMALTVEYTASQSPGRQVPIEL